MLKLLTGTIGTLLNPGFYSAQYTNLIRSLNKQFIQGSAVPLFQGMVLVGTIGYTAEYFGIGRKLDPL